MSGYPDGLRCLYEKNSKSDSRICKLVAAIRCSFDCRLDRLINNALSDLAVTSAPICALITHSIMEAGEAFKHCFLLYINVAN